MSEEARQALVASTKLSFTDDQQRTDLLDVNLTSTYLIALLQWLLDNCAEAIELLAVRSDHPTRDGQWAHSGGHAVDLYPSNWNNREREAVVAVLKSLAQNPYCEAIGLGGVTKSWKDQVTWPTEHFVVFSDNSGDHIHCGTMNAEDPEGARSKA